jgi:Asp-tRNA(Asn)/Glu-tRNA(Gln) amidotransferase A subunit family amidase
MDELTFLSAVTMAEQVRKKKIYPVELVEADLTKIECLNPKLNAHVHLDGNRTRRNARDEAANVISVRSWSSS